MVSASPSELPLDREDVVSIMNALLDIRGEVVEIHRLLLEENDGEEETEGNS
jgi:AAA+ superfamily predicted ATPase